MHKFIVRSFVSAAFVCFMSAAVAQEVEVRDYHLTDSDAIAFTVPLSWKEKVDRKSSDIPPTIIFSGEEKRSFNVLVTPLVVESTGVITIPRSEIKTIVSEFAQEAGKQSVEKVLPILEINSPSVSGYYFSATDRAPKPDEYEYLTQGMVQVGELSVTFTVLTNKGEEDVVAQVLLMMKSAVYKSH